MTWRTVLLTRDSKISLRLNHLVVSSDETITIPLDEIGQLVIENPNIVMTGHLLNALSKFKVTTIICDSKHMPYSQVNLIYGHFRRPKIIRQQLAWEASRMDLLWQKIIKHKIYNQKSVLEHFLPDTYVGNFDNYIEQVELNDETNREGHAAKVYFNQLFGKDFIRGADTPINWGLNYGYSLLLSLFTKVLNTKGLLTEIGIHHHSQYNHFNLASDFMEVYRPQVDYLVKMHIFDEFDHKSKMELLNIFNKRLLIKGNRQYLANSIEIYVNDLIKFLNKKEEEHVSFPTILL